MNANKLFSVRSINFRFHPPVWCATYADALAAAERRGWEAHIYHGAEGSEELVATWSIIGGVRVYNRALAA